MENKNIPEKSEFLFYTTEDGKTRVEVRLLDETVWLTQKVIAELFQKDVRTINEHINNIFEEGELIPDSVIRKFRITAADGKNDFSETNIKNFRQFYLTSPSDEKLYAPRRELVWSHYRMILPTEEEHKVELEREKSLILE